MGTPQNFPGRIRDTPESALSMSALPPSVDLRVLGACNLRCRFCFGPRHELGPQGMARMIELLPRLRVGGVSTLVITGGEPLLVHGLPDLLCAAHELGFQVVLSTNGTRLADRAPDVLP